MNAIVNPRLKRIQKVSRIFRTFFLIIAIVVALGAIGGAVIIPVNFPTNSPVTISKIELYAIDGNEFVCAICAWFCFRLFALYSRGELFTTDVVCAIRRVGYAYFLMVIVNFSLSPICNYFGKNDSLPPTKGPPDWLFDSLNLATGLFSGFLIIFIAWVMDEGRKIQEEQELTV